MITKENAKEFIKRTSDFVWIEDRKILKDNDILDLMVEFAQEQVKLFAIPDVINHGCSDCGGKLEYDVMGYWQCSICGKPQ